MVSRLGHIHFIQPCLCTPFLQTWNASSRDLCYDMYRSNCKQTFYPLNTNKHFSHLTPICVKERTGHHTSFVMHFKPYICVNFTLLTKGMKSIPPIGVLSVTRYVTPFLVWISYSSFNSVSFCACNTAWLATELLVAMGPNPYLWILHSKQRLLEPNNKSLRVPDITCRCVHAIQRD